MQESHAVQNGPPRVGEPLRVIVADDHACLRSGVANLLHTTGRASVVGEACNTLALARRLAVILHRMWVDGTDFRWSNSTIAVSAAG